jgi:uncharacterized coiled-coil protein SlyX
MSATLESRLAALESRLARREAAVERAIASLREMALAWSSDVPSTHDDLSVLVGAIADCLQEGEDLDAARVDALTGAVLS